MNKKIVIAIDGYSSCGKSSFAKAIAEELNILFVDSGAMYRAATLYFIRKQLVGNNVLHEQEIVDELSNVNVSFVFNELSGNYDTLLNGENVEKEIRTMEVSSLVSTISKMPAVRERMVDLQRLMGKDRSLVMDGRDIGTVVFPDADIKIFMTASLDIRAQRRLAELTGKGVKVNIEEIKDNIMLRDLTDENRDTSPLRKADDAILLDNSRMTIRQQMVWFNGLLAKNNDC